MTHPTTASCSPWSVHRQLLRTTTPAMRYDGGDVDAWQASLRARLGELLGMPRMPPRPAPPQATVLWEREHELGSITKLRFDCEPGCDGLAYLCLPRSGNAPPPVFICLQGHTSGMHNSIGLDYDEAKPIDIEGDRDFAHHCMKRGIAAFCLEQRSFGQRREIDIIDLAGTTTCHASAMNALMLGRTLAGERIFDVQRAIDYLEMRDDVDASRLGCMGNSGGGTITLYAAALEPRIRYAMPSCAFAPYEASIMAIRHCVDNFVPHLRLVAEAGDIAGLIAPRPLVIVNGRHDPLFPIDAAKQEFEHVQRIYVAAGAESQCSLIEGPQGHRFYADLAWPQMQARMAETAE